MDCGLHQELERLGTASANVLKVLKVLKDLKDPKDFKALKALKNLTQSVAVSAALLSSISQGNKMTAKHHINGCRHNIRQSNIVFWFFCFWGGIVNENVVNFAS